MSEKTAKPYLVRALYQWCVESAFTPYLVVQVTSETRVPMSYVRDGQITLNVSDTAVQRLTIDNHWVLFNARFNGTSQEVAVPMNAVIGIYARETGYGMGFEIPEVESAEAAPAIGSVSVMPSPADEPPTEVPGEAAKTGEAAPAAASDEATTTKSTRTRGHLSVVK